jgi:hypothetical protein
VLLELGLVNEEQLTRALTQQRTSRGRPLGELLVQQGALTREGLERALSVKQAHSAGAPRRTPAPAEGSSTPAAPGAAIRS